VIRIDESFLPIVQVRATRLTEPDTCDYNTLSPLAAQEGQSNASV